MLNWKDTMTSYKDLNITGLSNPNELNQDFCLLPDKFMDFHHPDIQSKVQELTNGLRDPWDKAVAVFQFVRDEIIYDFAPKISGPENWKASVILNKGRGFCHQKSILQSALYRAVGIPSAFTYQDVIDQPLMDTRYKELFQDGILYYHGLSVIFYNQKWIRQDATLDQGLCHRRGYRVGVVREGMETILPVTTLAGSSHFKIQKDHGYFESFDFRFSEYILSNLPKWNEWRSFVKNEHLTM